MTGNAAPASTPSAPSSPAAAIVQKASQAAAPAAPNVQPGLTQPNGQQQPQTPPAGSGGGTSTEPKSGEGGDFAERFASLTRREERHRQEVEAWKRDKTDYDAVRGLKDKAASSPLEVLAYFGLDYKSLTDVVLKDQKTQQPLTPEEKIEELRQQMEKDRKDREDEKQNQSQAAVEETLQGWRNDIAAHVRTEGEKYELINHYGQQALDLVWATTEEWYEAHKGTDQAMLPIDKACQMVEDHLVAESERLFGLKRFASKVDAPKTNVQPTPQGTSQPPPVQRTTLTNAQTNGGSSGEIVGESDEENRRRAAAMIKWSN